MSLDNFDPKSKHYLDVQENHLVESSNWDPKIAVRVINFLANANIRDHFNPKNAEGATRLLTAIERLAPRLAKDKPIAELMLHIISENDRDLLDFLTSIEFPDRKEAYRAISPYHTRIKKLLPILKGMSREMQLECLQRPELLQDMTGIYNRFPNDPKKAETQIRLVLKFLEIVSHSSNIKEQFLLYLQLENCTKQQIQSYRLNNIIKIFNRLEQALGKEEALHNIDIGLNLVPESALLEVLEFITQPTGIQHCMRTIAAVPELSVDLKRLLVFRGLTKNLNLKQDLLAWSKRPETLTSVHRSLALTIDSIRDTEQWVILNHFLETYKDLLHVNENGTLYQKMHYIDFLLEPEQRKQPNHPFNLENTWLRRQGEVALRPTHVETRLNGRPIRIVLEKIEQAKLSSQTESYFKSVCSKPQFLEKVCGKKVEGKEAEAVTRYLYQRLHYVFGFSFNAAIDWDSFYVPVSLVTMSTDDLVDLYCSYVDGDDLCGHVRVVLSTPKNELTIEEAEARLFEAGIFIR